MIITPPVDVIYHMCGMGLCGMGGWYTEHVRKHGPSTPWMPLTCTFPDPRRVYFSLTVSGGYGKGGGGLLLHAGRGAVPEFLVRHVDVHERT